MQFNNEQHHMIERLVTELDEGNLAVFAGAGLRGGPTCLNN